MKYKVKIEKAIIGMKDIYSPVSRETGYFKKYDKAFNRTLKPKCSLSRESGYFTSSGHCEWPQAAWQSQLGTTSVDTGDCPQCPIEGTDVMHLSSLRHMVKGTSPRSLLRGACLPQAGVATWQSLQKCHSERSEESRTTVNEANA